MKRKSDHSPTKIFTTYLPATTKFCQEVNAKLAAGNIQNTVVNTQLQSTPPKLTAADNISTQDSGYVPDSDKESSVSRIPETPQSAIDWDAIPGTDNELGYDVDHISVSDISDSESDTPPPGFSPRR